MTGLAAATPSRIARIPPPVSQPANGTSTTSPSPSTSDDQPERDEDQPARRSACAARSPAGRCRRAAPAPARSARCAARAAGPPPWSRPRPRRTTPATVRGEKISGCPDRSRPNWANSSRSSIASSTPEPEAEGGAEDAEDERLELHRPRDLALGGAERAQQGELAAALGDQDRERVDDEERPDDQGDAGEDQQERGDEARSPRAAREADSSAASSPVTASMPCGSTSWTASRELAPARRPPRR